MYTTIVTFGAKFESPIVSTESGIAKLLKKQRELKESRPAATVLVVQYETKDEAKKADIGDLGKGKILPRK